MGCEAWSCGDPDTVILRRRELPDIPIGKVSDVTDFVDSSVGGGRMGDQTQAHGLSGERTRFASRADREVRGRRATLRPGTCTQVRMWLPGSCAVAKGSLLNYNNGRKWQSNLHANTSFRKALSHSLGVRPRFELGNSGCVVGVFIEYDGTVTKGVAPLQ